MIPYSKRPHSFRKYRVNDEQWAPYMLKNIRSVARQERNMTPIRAVVKITGALYDLKIY